MSLLDELKEHFPLKEGTYSREEMNDLITGEGLLNPLASPSTDPPGDRYQGETWPVNTANYGSNFPNFGNINVPAKVGSQYVYNAKFVYDNGAWTLQYRTKDLDINPQQGFFARGLITIVANVVTFGTGSYYSINNDAVLSITLASPASYTLANGEALVATKTGTGTMTIDKITYTAIAPQSQQLLGYWDTTFGLTGVLATILKTKVLATDVRAAYFRGELITKDNTWQCTNDFIAFYGSNGVLTTRSLAASGTLTLTSGQSVIYRISAGAGNPIVVNTVDINFADDIILNSYDSVRGWFGGVLYGHHLRNLIGFRAQPFYGRAKPKLVTNVITLPASTYYVVDSEGNTLSRTLASDTSYTLSAGDMLVATKQNSTSFAISAIASTAYVRQTMLVLAYNDSVAGLVGEIPRMATLQVTNSQAFTALFRGNISATFNGSTGSWICTSGTFTLYTPGGVITKTLAATTFTGITAGQCIVYRISANSTTPLLINLTDAVAGDDIILNAFDTVKGWHDGVLNKEITRNILGLKIDGMFARGAISISGNVITFGAGTYYFIDGEGNVLSRNFGSSTAFTMSNGDLIVLTKQSITSGLISQIQLSAFVPQTMVVLTKYDAVAGFSKGLISQYLLENRVATLESGSGNQPFQSGITNFVVVPDTHTIDITKEDLSISADPAHRIAQYGNYNRQYSDILTYVNKLNPDFVTHIGDLIDLPIHQYPGAYAGALAYCARLEKRLVCPMYHVLGNHDVDFTTTTATDIQAFYGAVYDEYISNPETGNADGAQSKGYYHTTRNGLHILVLNTNSKDTGRTGAWYDIDSTQQAWFINELANIPDGRNIVVFSHIQLRLNTTQYVPPSGGSVNDVTLQDATVTALENAMISYLTTNKNSRVIGWFGGHIHQDNLKQVSISTSGGQAQLNYIGTNIAVYGHVDPLSQASELALYNCQWNATAKRLTVTGLGRGTSYTFNY